MALLDDMDRIHSARIFVELVADVKPQEEVLVVVNVRTTEIGELLERSLQRSLRLQ